VREANKLRGVAAVAHQAGGADAQVPATDTAQKMYALQGITCIYPTYPTGALLSVVVNVTMDLHGILNRVIQCINPGNITRDPAQLYATFQDALRECAIGESVGFLVSRGSNC